MSVIFDSATTLIPQGTINNSQSFTALPLDVRKLATCSWIVQITTNPVATATFVLEIATLQAGPYSAIQTLAWPAGQVGSRQIPLGVQGQVAAALNNTAAWIRCSVTCTG